MLDFNNVPEYELIPAGTICKAKLSLKPGNAPESPYLKASKNGGLYLDCEFVVLEGKYAKRKIFHKIGVEGNEEWVQISRRMIKNLLESANGLDKKDKSERAENLRKLNDWNELDGIELLIKVGITPEGEYQPQNKIQSVITAESPIYQQLMSVPW